MSTTPIDLSRLPPPDVVEEIDFEQLLRERKAALIALYPEDKRDEIAEVLEIESEPMLMLLQENAYRELLLRQRVNEAARSTMLAYAKDKDLDHLAAFFGITRLRVKAEDKEKRLPALLETNEDLRKRVQLAPQGYSVAGPEGAYKSHALNADPFVLDVSATSPAPCEVLVTVLQRGGDGTASGALLQKVTSALRANDVRPLTDKVTVKSAQIHRYKIRATLFTFSGPDAAVALNEARKRLTAYTAETHRLGRNVVISAIHAALHIDGIERVQLDEPLRDITISKVHAPYCESVDLRNGGVRE